MSPHRTAAISALFLAFIVTVGLAAPDPVRGAGPADPLLRLAPADAGLTVVVEDLKGHARSLIDLPVYTGLTRLPAVQLWMASDRGRAFREAKAQIEAILQTDFANVRDGLLGEAVVLALRTPPGGRPEDARGLLLTRIIDRPLLDRAVAGLDAAQTKKGELVRVSDRRRGTAAYHVREYRPGSRPDEFYAHLGDRVFAWSNSEELLLGVLDRQAEGSVGLGGLADFRRIRSRLPSRSVVSILVDPRFVERIAPASSGPRNPGDEPLLALLGRYLAAVRYAGAAVEWRDGVILHTEEVVDPAKLSPGLRRWAGRTDHPDPGLLRVPPSALAFAVAHVDAGALIDVLAELTPEAERAKLDNLLLTLDGLLLGLDLRKEVAPHLGPGLSAYIERPDSGEPSSALPLVVEAELATGSAGTKTAAALDNALRTLLAVYALDSAHGGGKLQVESRGAPDARITTFRSGVPVAYSLAEGSLVLARSAGSAARALAARRDPGAAQRIERLRAAFFPGVESFACADLEALHAFASSRRVPLCRRMAEFQKCDEAEVSRDLDQALALIALFDAAFVTSVIEPGFSGVHRTFGFVTLPTPAHP